MRLVTLSIILINLNLVELRLLIVDREGELKIDLELIDGNTYFSFITRYLFITTYIFLDLVTDRYGNKLKYFFVRKNWYEADRHCKALGGNLPTIEDKTKNYEVCSPQS